MHAKLFLVHSQQIWVTTSTIDYLLTWLVRLIGTIGSWFGARPSTVPFSMILPFCAPKAGTSHTFCIIRPYMGHYGSHLLQGTTLLFHVFETRLLIRNKPTKSTENSPRSWVGKRGQKWGSVRASWLESVPAPYDLSSWMGAFRRA